MQTYLRRLGYLNATPDGVFGTNTEKAVREFQMANCLLTAFGANLTTMLKIFNRSNVDAKTNEIQKSYEAEVIRLVNVKRAKYGLSPLTEHLELSRAARYKSQDMSDHQYFSHTSPTYGSPFEMMEAFDITFLSAGENIACGYGTPAEVVSGWMNSPGHRDNILDPSFNQIGVGYVAKGRYWTQMFIRGI